MIKLYEGITPNNENSSFYIFKDIEKYKTSLFPYLSISIEEDKFSLNENSLTISASSLAGLDPFKFSYIEWEFNSISMFYHIEDVKYQSEYFIFSIALDLWASYFYKANIADFFVNRTACHIPNKRGFLDPISATNEREVEYISNDFLPSAISLNDLSVVYYVTYETGKSSLLSNESASATKGFFNSIPELCGNLDVSKENALSSVAGIHETTTATESNDAIVIKAYIVPSSVIIPPTEGEDTTFVTSSNINFLANDLNAHPLVYGINNSHFSVYVEPDYKYYVGVQRHGIELTRVYGNHNVRIAFIFNVDNLQVLLYDGDLSFDITDAFEVGITTNNGNMNATERVAKVLRMIGGVGSGMAQAKQGNVGGSIASFADVINTALPVSGSSNHSGGGDGFITFEKITTTFPAQSPFCVVKYKSVIDENEKARKTGLSFNTSMDIFNPLSGEIVGDYRVRGYYIKGNAFISGIPLYASNYIAGIFENGNYFKQIL